MSFKPEAIPNEPAGDAKRSPEQIAKRTVAEQLRSILDQQSGEGWHARGMRAIVLDFQEMLNEGVLDRKLKGPSIRTLSSLLERVVTEAKDLPGHYEVDYGKLVLAVIFLNTLS